MKINSFSLQWFSFLIFATFFLPIFSVAQTTNNKPLTPIRSVRVVDGSMRKRVLEFHDTLTRNLINKIDLVEVNPFGKFKAKIAEIWDDYSTPIFELDTISDRIVESLDSIELVSKTNHYNTPKLRPFRLLSSYFISNQSQKYVAVLYELTTLNIAGRNISSHVTILVYDDQGRFVLQTPIGDVNGDVPAISDDGRFIAFFSGGPYGWEQAGYSPNSLIAFDTQTRKMFFDDQVEIGESIQIIDGMLLGYYIISGRYGTIAIVYDFLKGIKYTRKFSFEELPSFKEIKGGGYYFLNPSGETYLKYTLENDFSKTKIAFEK